MSTEIQKHNTIDATASSFLTLSKYLSNAIILTYTTTMVCISLYYFITGTGEYTFTEGYLDINEKINRRDLSIYYLLLAVVGCFWITLRSLIHNDLVNLFGIIFVIAFIWFTIFFDYNIKVYNNQYYDDKIDLISYGISSSIYEYIKNNHIPKINFVLDKTEYTEDDCEIKSGIKTIITDVINKNKFKSFHYIYRFELINTLITMISLILVTTKLCKNKIQFKLRLIGFIIILITFVISIIYFIKIIKAKKVTRLLFEVSINRHVIVKKNQKFLTENNINLVSLPDAFQDM